MHANIDIVSGKWYREIFLVAQTVGNLTAMWATWVRSLGREDALKKEMQPTPVFLPGESHGQRSLVDYTVHGVAINQTRLSD